MAACRVSWVVLVVVAATVLVSCGSPVTTPSQDAGSGIVESTVEAVPASQRGSTESADSGDTGVGESSSTLAAVDSCNETVDPVSLPEVLVRIARAVAMDGQAVISQLGGQDPIAREFLLDPALTDASVELLVGDVPPELWRLPSVKGEALIDAGYSGWRVAFFLHPKDVSLVTVMVDDADRVSFVADECSGYRRAFDRFLDSEHADPAATELDELVRLVTDPSANQTFSDIIFHKPERLSWSERDPWDRSIDPAETPHEMLTALDAFMITVQIPEAWQPLDLVVCTRVPTIGWNDCAPVTDGYPERIPIYGWAAPDDVLEVWIGDIRGRVDMMYGLAATLQPTDVAGNDLIIALRDTAPTRAEVEAAPDASDWVTIIDGP